MSALKVSSRKDGIKVVFDKIEGNQGHGGPTEHKHGLYFNGRVGID